MDSFDTQEWNSVLKEVTICYFWLKGCGFAGLLTWQILILRGWLRCYCPGNDIRGSSWGHQVSFCNMCSLYTGSSSSTAFDL